MITNTNEERLRREASGKRPSRRTGGAKRKLSTTAQTSSTYIWIAAVSGLVTIVFLCIYIWMLPRLVNNGVHRQVYYFLLFPLALAVAALCFGVMGSYATYRGSAVSGTLRLSGPIVGVGLVVIGGFWLVPSSDVFAVTVRVFGPNGIKLRGGSILIYLGSDTRSAPLASNGEANFKEIPNKFRNQKVKVGAEIAGYRLSDDISEVTLMDSLTLNAVVDPNAAEPILADSFSVTARVLDDTGRPVRSGTVTLYLGSDTREEPIAQNGEANFKEIPIKFNGKPVPVRVDAPGFQMAEPHQMVSLRESFFVQMRVASVNRRSVGRQSGIIQQSAHSPAERN